MSIELTDETREGSGERPPPQDRVVEVRRRPGIAAAIGVGASVVALAYLVRALQGGGLGDWVLAAAIGLIAVAHVMALLDARTPLLVADELGLRLRLGRSWVGLPWGGLHEVEHRARRGWWRDGLLTVRTHYVQRVLEDLDPRERRLARLNRRLHGAPLAVPLGLGTRVVGASPDLTTVLRDLADGRTPIVDSGLAEGPTFRLEGGSEDGVPVVDPGLDAKLDPELDVAPMAAEERPPAGGVPDPRPALAHLIGRAAATFRRPARDTEAAQTDEAALPGEPAAESSVTDAEPRASRTPPLARDTVAAARAEVRHEPRVDVDVDADVDLDDVLEEETQVWADLHPVAEEQGADPVLDVVVTPPVDPVIGPELAAARERLRLSVDELADRTRIRPHVIEAIEVDDFSACGGDFYARGHLRTLARVLGLEVAPILTAYDERYADAPIDPRRVFEAELAGAGSIRATRGGPNWSVLVAAVMALILCWSIARLVTGGAGPDPDQAVLSGSGGPNHRTSVPVGKPVPVTLDASSGGARVVVRDGTGKVVFSGDLAYGQRHTMRAATPVQVQSSDGGVRVTVDGQGRGRMGPAGRPATQSYGARGR